MDLFWVIDFCFFVFCFYNASRFLFYLVSLRHSVLTKDHSQEPFILYFVDVPRFSGEKKGEKRNETKRMEKISHQRKKFIHQGRTIYEWEQTLEEVVVIVEPPKGVRGSNIDCRVTSTKVILGLKGAPKPYLEEELWGRAKASESFWTLEDGMINVTVAKAERGVAWAAAFKAHVDRADGGFVAQEDARKELLLERFQEEHPGFDFSSAQFSGAAPDPSTFMR